MVQSRISLPAAVGCSGSSGPLSQAFRLRARADQRLMKGSCRRRKARLKAVLARTVAISLPNVDALKYEALADFPDPRNALRLGGPFTRPSEYPLARPKTKLKLEIVRQAVVRRQLEGQKPGLRVSEPQCRPSGGYFSLNGPFGADLAGDEQEVGHSGSHGILTDQGIECNRSRAQRVAMICGVTLVILSAAKNLAEIPAYARFFACAQNDGPCQEILPHTGAEGGL